MLNGAAFSMRSIVGIRISIPGMVDTSLFCFQGLIKGCHDVHTVVVSSYTVQMAKMLMCQGKKMY